MKHISKKEFNRFYKIMKANPDKSVMALHELYKKDLMHEANNLVDINKLTKTILRSLLLLNHNHHQNQ